MPSLADLLRSQNFGPNDSPIFSSINHPLRAGKKISDWIARQTQTAAGIPDQYDNPNPLLAPSPERQAQAAFDLAGLAQVGAFPFAPKVGKGTLGTMGGIRAANAPKEQFAKAEELAKALKLSDFPVGSDDWMNANRNIWGQTGIHYGADNMPRFEIDDSGALITKATIDENAGLPALAFDVMPHKKLQEQYSMEGIPTFASIHESYAPSGSFESRNGNHLISFKANDYESGKSTLLHELSHAIQQGEGFARGGSPDSMTMPEWPKEYNKEYEAIRQQINDLRATGNLSGIKSLMDNMTKTSREAAFRAYENLAGEAEARAVQKRMDYTPEQRAQIFPLDDYDRNISDLIVRRGDGPNMSVSNNLNESLLSKYLTTGKLSPEELAQYEANAVQMRDSNRQYLNVANADAQGGTAMDRARGMGFDSDWYHGTSYNEIIPEFDVSLGGQRGMTQGSGVYMAQRPKRAGLYSGETGQIMPLMTSVKSYNWGPENMKPGEFVTGLAIPDELKKPVQKKMGYRFPKDSPVYPDAELSKDVSDAVRDVLQNKGYSGVVSNSMNGQAQVVFDPKNIRSRFAAFDPLRKDSADLLASYLLPATMLGYGMYNENKKGSLADWLGGR